MKNLRTTATAVIVTVLAAFLFISSSLRAQTRPPSIENYKVRCSTYLKGIFLAEEGEYKQALVELEKSKNLDKSSIYLRLKIASILI